jgi:RNase H-fold protein (predicted Holliday junction resolvase)
MKITGNKRVMAFDVRPRSFGFAVFEGPDRILDWGVRSFRTGMNRVQVPAEKKVATLIEEFAPSVVVLGSKALDRLGTKAQTRDILDVLHRRAGHRITVRLISAARTRKSFPNARNKYERALAIAAAYPDLSWKLPPKRKPWQTEDYRMSIFDAAALGVAYFGRPLTVPADLSDGPRQRHHAL